MKRAYMRYRAKGGALVAFSIPHFPPIATMKRVLDISKGGLSFYYIAAQRQELAAPEVDLFWRSVHEASVSGIPCEIVYDTGEGGERAQHARFRRCGIKFGGLTKEQESRLEDFITHCTESEA